MQFHLDRMSDYLVLTLMLFIKLISQCGKKPLELMYILKLLGEHTFTSQLNIASQLKVHTLNRLIIAGKEKTLFAFSFLKLSTEEKTMIVDNEQQLQIYKIPSKAIEKKAWYLTDTSGSIFHQFSYILELIPRKGEYIQIRNTLASTIHPQSHVLLKILNWGTNVTLSGDTLRRVESLQQSEYQGDLERVRRCSYCLNSSFYIQYSIQYARL